MKKIKGRKYLKSRFRDGACPTGQDFADLINSTVNQKSDQVHAVGNKLGIGTATPEATLEVKGTCSGQPTLKSTDGANSTLWISHPASAITALATGEGEALMIGSQKSSNSHFQPKMTVQRGGNVGIGVQKPRAKLDVNGSAYVRKDLHVKSSASIGQNLQVGEKLILSGHQLWIENNRLKINIGGKTYILRMSPDKS